MFLGDMFRFYTWWGGSSGGARGWRSEGGSVGAHVRVEARGRWLRGHAAAPAVGGERGQRVVVEHGVVARGRGGRVPGLEAGGRHRAQRVHAGVRRPGQVRYDSYCLHQELSLLPVGVRHGARLRDGRIHRVEAGVERQPGAGGGGRARGAGGAQHRAAAAPRAGRPRWLHRGGAPRPLLVPELLLPPPLGAAVGEPNLHTLRLVNTNIFTLSTSK